MCLFPRKIKNPCKNVNFLGGQPLFIEVPCNQCAECKKQKRLEWRMRSFYECQDILSKGGFIYFDTLTYDDEHLPHCSDYLPEYSNLFDEKKLDDFSCFNHTHFKNFLKNIRRQLNYHHKGVQFKYFLSSEYGTDERYTHRPHYHILFFVNNKTINPFQFSELVSKCWPYGRTDGLPYQSRNYVIEHSYGYFPPTKTIDTDKEITVMTLCNYVSKYVTKDSTFQEEIDNRLSILSKYLDDDEMKQLKRNINMFNRQSQGFGISYINNMSPDEYTFVFNNGACRLEDKKKVTMTIALPLYYKRKLFYKCVKDFDNSLRWIATPTGKQFKENHLLRCIERATRKYIELISNNETYLDIISKYLGNRTIEDFTIYKLFYKGRCRNLVYCYDINKSYCKPNLTDEEYNLYDWLQRIINDPYDDEYYLIPRNREQNYIDIPLYNDLYNPKLINFNYDSFLKNAVFNEDSCTAFRNFDKLDSLFNAMKQPDNNQQQKTFDFVEYLQKRFKTLYYE